MLKRFFTRRILITALASVIVLTLVLLAVSLRDLHFQPGRLLRQDETSTIQISVDKVVEEIVSIPLWKQILFWASAFLVVFAVALLFPPELRRRIIRFFVRLALFVLAVYFIMKNYRWLFPGLAFSQESPVATNTQPIPEYVPPVFTPPQISTTQLYLVSLGIVLALAAVALFISLRWLRKRRLQMVSQPLEDLAEIARSSLADISAGGSWENAIIQCYARMSAVVGEKKGVHRRQDLTPREFAERLEKAGLTSTAVSRLTGLFESVRYGARKANPEEINEATACLTTILLECGVDS